MACLLDWVYRPWNINIQERFLVLSHSENLQQYWIGVLIIVLDWCYPWMVIGMDSMRVSYVDDFKNTQRWIEAVFIC